MKRVVTIALSIALLAGCSSTAGSTTASSTSAAIHGSSSVGATAAGDGGSSTPIALGAPVTSGPLGGSYCAATSVYYSPSAGGITVTVMGDGPADGSVQVVDAANNPIGSGTFKISDVMRGGQVDIAVANKSAIAGVDLAMGGSITGICVVPKAS
jgi:hypothetical protein